MRCGIQLNFSYWRKNTPTSTLLNIINRLCLMFNALQWNWLLHHACFQWIYFYLFQLINLWSLLSWPQQPQTPFTLLSRFSRPDDATTYRKGQIFNQRKGNTPTTHIFSSRRLRIEAEGFICVKTNYLLSVVKTTFHKIISNDCYYILVYWGYCCWEDCFLFCDLNLYNWILSIFCECGKITKLFDCSWLDIYVFIYILYLCATVLTSHYDTHVSHSKKKNNKQKKSLQCRYEVEKGAIIVPWLWDSLHQGLLP